MNKELRNKLKNLEVEFLPGVPVQLPNKTVNALYQLVVEERFKEVVAVVDGTYKESYEDYLNKRIKELQSQLSSIGESK